MRWGSHRSFIGRLTAQGRRTRKTSTASTIGSSSSRHSCPARLWKTDGTAGSQCSTPPRNNLDSICLFLELAKSYCQWFAPRGLTSAEGVSRTTASGLVRSGRTILVRAVLRTPSACPAGIVTWTSYSRCSPVDSFTFWLVFVLLATGAWCLCEGSNSNYYHSSAH